MVHPIFRESNPLEPVGAVPGQVDGVGPMVGGGGQADSKSRLWALGFGLWRQKTEFRREKPEGAARTE